MPWRERFGRPRPFGRCRRPELNAACETIVTATGRAGGGRTRPSAGGRIDGDVATPSPAALRPRKSQRRVLFFVSFLFVSLRLRTARVCVCGCVSPSSSFVSWTGMVAFHYCTGARCFVCVVCVFVRRFFRFSFDWLGMRFAGRGPFHYLTAEATHRRVLPGFIRFFQALGPRAHGFLFIRLSRHRFLCFVLFFFLLVCSVCVPLLINWHEFPREVVALMPIKMVLNR